MGNNAIGFVGLGIMGRPMVKNLIKAGYTVTVYDIIAAAVEEMVSEGASQASSAAEAARGMNTVITMVPDSADSEAAIMGAGGVLEGVASGSTIIDMSSIAPGMSQRIGSACENAGVNFLDAPVSGGEPKAIDGTLAIMVGGKRETFDKYVEIFEVLGGSVVLC